MSVRVRGAPVDRGPVNWWRRPVDGMNSPAGAVDCAVSAIAVRDYNARRWWIRFIVCACVRSPRVRTSAGTWTVGTAYCHGAHGRTSSQFTWRRRTQPSAPSQRVRCTRDGMANSARSARPVIMDLSRMSRSVRAAR